MRQQRFWSGLVMALTVLASIVSAPSTAAARAPGVTANCGGWILVSANYVRLTNGSGSIVGSIQLCKKTAHTGDYEYFARIEMYNALPAGRMANAFLYSTGAQGGRGQVSCHSNGTQLFGPTERRVCYSTHVIDVTVVWDFQAIGRYYRADGPNWVLMAEGATALIPGA